MPKVNIDLKVKTKENKKRNCRGFIYVSSRRATGFCRQSHVGAQSSARGTMESVKSSSKASNIIN